MARAKNTIKRVLVTGATGFLGRASLLPLVERGYEIHAITRREFPAHSKEIVWHYGDLLNREFIEKLVGTLRPTHLLAFAWHMKPGDTYHSLENFRWVEASLHLLRCFGQNGGRRVVMAGSCAEYDWHAGTCHETSTQLLAKSQYGVAKQALYLSFLSMCDALKISGAWGRLFFVYGPHEHPQRLASSIIVSLLDNRFADCSSGQHARDFMHVEDAASAYVALLDSKVEARLSILAREGPLH